MSTASGSNGPRQNGQYFLSIENLPRKYTWQDLKDLIRQQAHHGLWTDMQVFPNGQPSGSGHARVQRKDEAFRLYRYLTENMIENRNLRVHLFDTSIPNSEPVFLQCNCGNTHQSHSDNYNNSIMHLANQPGWHTFNMTSPGSVPQSVPYANAPIVGPPTQVAPMHPQQLMQIAQNMASLSLNYQDPAHVQRYRELCYERQVQIQQAQAVQRLQLQQQQPPPPPPQQRQYQTWATNERGIPVNASQGYVRTEARGVFVSGLNFKARAKDIENHFKKAGTIMRIDVPKDAKTDKSKGNATIQYSSVEEAQRAIRMFDKQKFMDMRVVVRPDRETTAVSVPPTSSSTDGNAVAGASQASMRTNTEPTIVNGSQVGSFQPA